jgi:hypothetical protein
VVLLALDGYLHSSLAQKPCKTVSFLSETVMVLMMACTKQTL